MNGPPGAPGVPGGELPPPKLSADLLRFFWRFVKPDKGKLALASLGLMIHAAVSVGMAAIPTLIDKYWKPETRHFLLLLLGGLLAVSLLVLFLQLGISWLITGISENVLRRVRLAIFDKIGVMPSEEMSFQSVGKFAQRTTGDVMRLGALVTPGIPQLLLSSLQLIYMTIALLVVNPQFGWVFPVALILVWMIVKNVNLRVRYWARKDQLKFEDIMTHFIEAIGGCRDLIASGRFRNSVDAYSKELDLKQRFVISASIWNSLSGLVPMGIFALLSFGYYIYKVDGAAMTGNTREVGEVLSYAALLVMAQGPVMTLFRLSTDAELSAPSLFELKKLLTAPEVKDPPFTKAIASGEIEFKHVTFLYGANGPSGGMPPPPLGRNGPSHEDPRLSKAREGDEERGGREMGPPPGVTLPRGRDMGPPPGMTRQMGPPPGARMGPPPDRDMGREIAPSGPMQGPGDFGPPAVLNDVNIHIKPGTFAAIVGQSGSGKTTLFYLLLRLLEPVAGEIVMGGVRLDQIPLIDLRNEIGFIPQSPFIFSGSIRQNLLMGASAGDVPEERILHAVRMAKLEELIEKRRHSGGLDAPVGAGGASLSAGERQRIALGRIFLRDPRVIVCDEYTANIDNATARLIQEALKTQFADKTRIVITHQLYTIRGADQIFVLEKGRIVESGSHPDLLARGGLYRDMWEVQRVE